MPKPKPAPLETLISMKDKIGYALGDMGLQLTICLVGPFLTMFYTDVVGLPLGQITVMMLLTRIWSAFADPIAGSLLDKARPRKQGRFRPWILIFAAPMAASVAMLFINPGFGPKGSLLWAYIANLAYGTLFTGANIPYGSLASVISPLESDRSALSTFRSLGAGVGAAPVTVILPQVIYSVNAAGVEYLDANRLLLSVVVLAVFAGGVLSATPLMTRERVAVPANTAPPNTGKTMLALLKNRPFLVLCLASMLQVGMVIYGQIVNNYLFKDYFLQPKLYSMFSVATYAPMAILLFAMEPLVRRFGKKELCSAGLVISVAAYFLAFALKTTNLWVYLVFCFFIGLGLTCFTYQIWAFVTDVLDYQAMLSGQRDEGTAFGCYFFSRKIGQTIASFGAPLVLKALGYAEAADGVAVVQAASVAEGMYRAATLVPGIAILGMFLLMAFAYPLNRAKLAEMRERLAAQAHFPTPVNCEKTLD